jgi:hypothetical protein
MPSKVVIDNAVLKGSRDEHFLQRVATVYVDSGEFRILAPPKATGDALEWRDHFLVRRPNPEAFGSEIVIMDGSEHSIIQQVVEELERRKLDADIWRLGVNPDGKYCAAQICRRGHVQSANGESYKPGEHCTQCGEACVDTCQHCKAPIRGNPVYGTGNYDCPSFCYKCGRPYPWMEDRLQTAKDLLYHDDKLLLEDRERLWGLLQYVMSDPKSDLVPAKKKLIEIDLGKAAAATKDFVTDLLVKYAAEMTKG